MSWTSEIFLINFRRLSKENVLLLQSSNKQKYQSKHGTTNFESLILRFFLLTYLAIDWNLSQSRNTKKLGIMKFGVGIGSMNYQPRCVKTVKSKSP